jgi:Protein of unknown function (DUF1616)
LRGYRDLRRASIGAVVCALVATLLPWEVVRIAAALPLTLLLPGYAIVALSFGSGEPTPSKLWTLSVGVSLAVLALAALVLNVFPFGLTTASWAVLLVALVLAACRGAALRRGRPEQVRRRQRRALRPSPRDLGFVTTAILVAVAALVLAQTPLRAEHAVGFTALWVLPEDAREEAVVVGVLSSEQNPASYTLRVNRRWSRPRTYHLRLDPGQEQTFRLAIPRRRGGGRTHVVASLYQADRPGHLYRRVSTWLPRQKTFPRTP